MKPVFFSLSFLFLGLFTQAQQYHFIYLQTENKQPFYLRLNEKLYSSSSTGYVIIPKLPGGNHTLSIGFPKDAWPTQSLTINIANKDLGFLLKNFDSKGWGLFNLQTMEIVTSSSLANTGQASVDTKSDEFSSLLADVVNTPSIKKKEEKEKLVKNETIREETEVKKEVEVLTEVPAKEVILPTAPPVYIQKLSSAADTEGVLVVYLDKQNNVTDTISVFIPRGDKLPEQVQTPVSKIEVFAQPAATKAKPVEDAKMVEKNSPKFIDITLPNPNLIQDSSNKNIEVPLKKVETKITGAGNPSQESLNFNSDCKKMADEQDFLKVRKKMTSEMNDDRMVEVAKKLFRGKCYSTEQIKNLSVLFLKDEGKYKLFDAAYPYVYDTQQFKQLESQLTDQYIISRFKAMIRN